MNNSVDIPAPSERGRFDWSPHSRALGFEFVSAEKAFATLKLPFRDDLVGDPDAGVIAGGAVTALLDHVCGHAVMTALDAMTSIATLDLRIDYMRAAEPGLGVYAEAHCYKVTRSIAFVLVVDDFGIKYQNRDDFDYLVSSLSRLYQVKASPVTTKFLGFTASTFTLAG